MHFNLKIHGNFLANAWNDHCNRTNNNILLSLYVIAAQSSTGSTVKESLCIQNMCAVLIFICWREKKINALFLC